MDIIKKNIVSIIFGLIAILAVIAAFYPMSGKFAELSTQLETRKAKYQEAKTIIDKPRELPVIVLEDTSARTPLPIFPMPIVTKMAQGYMDKLVSESRGVFQAAVKVNRHECRLDDSPAEPVLLVAGALPEPRGNVENEFRRALVPDSSGNSIYNDLRTKVLGGGFPPTDDDIKKAEEALQAKYAKDIVKNAEGNPINEQTVMEAFQAERALLPAKLKNKMATESRMYVDPEVLMAPKEISGSPTAPNAQLIWYVQASLWLQMDVCRAIAETNANSKNIPDAPVKRLLALNIPVGPAMYTRGTATTSDAAPAAAPAVAEPRFNRRMGGGYGGEGRFPQAQAFPVEGGADLNVTGSASNGEPQKQYALTPTGRVSNNIYDVIEFTMVVHVDQTQLPLLLANLSRNRFITVKKLDLLRKDPNELLAAGFVYGSAPIAEVTLVCEALQLREWTVPLMPQIVRNQLLGPGVEYVSQLKPEKKAE